MSSPDTQFPIHFVAVINCWKVFFFFFFFKRLPKVENSRRIQSTDMIPLKKDAVSVPPLQDMNVGSVTCSNKCFHLLPVCSELANK